MTQKKILILEDTPSMAMICEECLKRHSYDTQIVTSGADALEALRHSVPDAILLDVGLPDMDGIELLETLRGKGLNCAVVVMTGQASLNIAVKAIQAGADDFVAKPFNEERLLVTLANTLEKKRLEKIVSTYEEISRSNFAGFIGSSPEMQSAYHIIENASRSTAPVMITGESGTGKELAAQAIHAMGTRKTKEIVALNCAAIPHDLLESEIFGHVKGAFTGATADREGAALRANHGTLFLDELTEMPMALQSKLLRFAQTGIFTPVGGSKEIESDIRLVCATNRDPLKAVHDGQLREDLYYRLSVIPVELPPLRKRGEDIILLSDYFLQKASRQEKKNFQSIDGSAKLALQNYNWPGNVRELENIIRHAVVMNNGPALTARMLNLSGRSAPLILEAANTPIYSGIMFNCPEDIRLLSEMERDIIQNALKICNGNITEAARRLGINPSTIHRKQKEAQSA